MRPAGLAARAGTGGDMDTSEATPRGVEFDDDLLADVPLGSATADRVIGGRGQEASAKQEVRAKTTQERSRKSL
jgi:hypothetical protein